MSTESQKEFVNFPIKLPNDLHEALRAGSYNQRTSIHKLILETLREKWTSYVR